MDAWVWLLISLTLFTAITLYRKEIMTTAIDGRVTCDARAAECRCFKDAGHVEAGDPVHACDQRRCTGEWTGTWPSPDFRLVCIPVPLGMPEPWDLP